MSNPRGRALPDLLSMYFVMLILHSLDVLFLKSDLTVLGENFYAQFLCFTVIVMLVLFKRERIRNLGISEKKEKFKTAAIFGTVFSTVPLLAILAGELAVAKAFLPQAINISFKTPNISFVESNGLLSPASCIIIFFSTTLFASCFKEMYFRGILLHKLEKLAKFKSANIFQAMLYTAFVIPLFLREFSDKENEKTPGLIVLTILFYLAHEFITGIKWGIMAKVSGATYMSIIDHTLYAFLSCSLVSVGHSSSEQIIMFNMICTQLVSLLLVYLYGRKKLKKNREAEDQKEKEEAESERKAQKFDADYEKEAMEEAMRAEQSKSLYSADIIQDAEAISPDQFKDIVRSADKSSKSEIEDLPEEEIDDFLKNYGKPQHHYNPPEEKKAPKKEDLNFDVDDFLKDYTNKE
ncbi:MAG: type II CAAX prenyl endopeptidase Rce1 family protein [Acutalibacteraceae bacterium]